MRTIIIGGGVSAMTCASKLRRNDATMEIIVYQASSYVSLGACGIPYYIAEEFDNVNDLLARTPDWFEKQNIQIFLNSQLTAVDFDKKVVMIGNQVTSEIITKQYDNLVIATGAMPIVPKFENDHLGNIFTAVSKEDIYNIKKQVKDKQKIAIIGGGFIGLELVEAFSHLQKEVILVEALERVGAKAFDVEITTIIQEYLLEKTVQVHCSKELLDFQGENDVQAIVLANNEIIAADLVVLAPGFRPHTQLFKDTGLEMLDKGAIVIDHQGKTNIANVYSVGDCATITNLVTKKQSYLPLTTAVKLARVIANVDDRLEGTLGSVILQIVDLQVARTGLSEWEAKVMNFNYQTIIIDNYDLPNYMSKQMPLKLKLLYEVDSLKLLGAQIVGYNKVFLRINALAVAICKQMTLPEIAKLDLVYAPPFGCTSDIIHIGASKIKK
ncbi:FAD-dependent oxidoreductase [Spiroplasma endosymbiont of 'Nebria riversi']|uniref:FAD-dependent oxidoreductase n=1 Tax=Spiroplasma endosymbiont of 'Nebria riversi' TaxID=2792084 RepID=UPI001C043BF0|nr:FAD-dependent oxidoreductase [Spiroplasma endosymbiont of 'Nebria riversi']